MKKAVVWLLAAGLLIGGGYTVYTKWGAAPQQEGRRGRDASPPPVTTAAVTRRDVPLEYSTFSHVEASASVDIYPRVDGQITAITVTSGQYVKKGDLLFTLDDRALQAQLAQAKASLEQNTASLQGARTTLARKKAMFARKAASEQDVEDAQTRYNTLKASIDADNAAISLARTQLSYTRIEAPFDGRLGNIAVNVGAIVKASGSTALVTLRRLDPAKVIFALPERYFNQLQSELQQGPVPVSLELSTSQGAERVEGHVAYIDNGIDTASGTLPVYAEFANPDRRLWPGQFGRVTLRLGLDRQATVVPQTAIKDGPDSPYVFVLRQDGTVMQQNVTVARIARDLAVVSEGLSDGQEVIVSGQQNLRNGIRVHVTSDGDKPGQEAAASAASQSGKHRKTGGPSA